MIDFWGSKNAFWDLDDPEEYCCKISARRIQLHQVMQC